MMEISDIGAVRSLINVALQKQVTDIILSPGSRNAPLILSFNALKEFRCLSVLDERTAGFIALGMAQQSGRPVLLSCTSGSAMLGYGPALAEAFYQNIPLIAVTADRPAEWIDQGEGQSIRQQHLMDGIVLKSFNLVDENGPDARWHNQRLLNEAFELAMHKRLPVHINVPLREPLYNTAPFEGLARSGFRIVGGLCELPEGDLQHMRSTWAQSTRIMVLCTQMPENRALLAQLKHHADDPRVAILTETTANLYHFGFVCCIDRTIEGFLETEQEPGYVPDLLITIGANIISKKLKAMLRRNKEHMRHHWHFGAEVMDTFQVLSALLHVSPSSAMAAMKSVSPEVTSDFGTRWRSKFFEMEQRHTAFLQTCAYSDLSVFHTLLDYVPEGWQIQMGNSSVVRYIQLFNQLQGVRYFGNRGVSGIEGCTSTAVGAALASDGPVLLISGDHAFRYDSNALSFKPLPANLKIIVINNGGGNIFRIIEGPQKHEVSEEFIEKRDETSIRMLAGYHRAVYREARDLDSLANLLEYIFDPANNQCVVAEIFTPRIESPQILMDYFKNLKHGNL